MQGVGKNVHEILVGKPEGKREYDRHRSTWENNFKMHLKERSCKCELN
jgi:hypothetical protein